MTPPRIGITGNTRTFSGAERSGVNGAYVRAVLRSGALPFILPPLLGARHAAQYLDACDALVLTGGEDVDPGFYGEAPHPKLGDVDRLRDEFELALTKGAWERRLPILAICRGIQVVNVALGGTLWQDIPSQRPGGLEHKAPTERDIRSHLVTIASGSRLARALATVRTEVNSFHHQSVRDVAPGLVVTATAPDGEIEGLESGPDDPWLLAVQWHPEEFHHHEVAPDHGLFNALVAAARAVPAGR